MSKLVRFVATILLVLAAATAFAASKAEQTTTAQPATPPGTTTTTAAVASDDSRETRPIASARKPKERAARRTPVRRLSLLLNFPSVLVDA